MVFAQKFTLFTLFILFLLFTLFPETPSLDGWQTDWLTGSLPETNLMQGPDGCCLSPTPDLGGGVSGKSVKSKKSVKSMKSVIF